MKLVNISNCLMSVWFLRWDIGNCFSCVRRHNWLRSLIISLDDAFWYFILNIFFFNLRRLNKIYILGFFWLVVFNIFYFFFRNTDINAVFFF